MLSDKIQMVLNSKDKRIAELEIHLGKMLLMLNDLQKESERYVELGEEDAFRMNEWFILEDNEAIADAAAALKGAYE
jgi:hypothetical protein